MCLSIRPLIDYSTLSLNLSIDWLFTVIILLFVRPSVDWSLVVVLLWYIRLLIDYSSLSSIVCPIRPLIHCSLLSSYCEWVIQNKSSPFDCPTVGWFITRLLILSIRWSLTCLFICLLMHNFMLLFSLSLSGSLLIYKTIIHQRLALPYVIPGSGIGD